MTKLNVIPVGTGPEVDITNFPSGFCNPSLSNTETRTLSFWK